MKRIKLLPLLILALLATTALDLSAQSDATKTLIPDSNFRNLIIKGNGITFVPDDSLFSVKLRFRAQSMAGMSFDDNFTNGSTEARIKRLRLRLEGHMFSPKIFYAIQLGFSPYDVSGLPTISDDEEDFDYANFVRDATVWYRPTNNWDFGFGQTKIQGNRARVNSSSMLQFVDRSIVNSAFNSDRDFGFFGWYKNNMDAKFGVMAKTSVTMGEGRNIFSNDVFGLAYTGRLELFPNGLFEVNLGEPYEGDWKRITKPRLMIGAVYSFNDNATRVNGQRGEFNVAPDPTNPENTIVQSRDIQSIFADLIFKYRGFAFYTDYLKRSVVNGQPFSLGAENPTYTTLVGQGLSFQTSYCFPSMWEIAARNSSVMPEEQVQNIFGYKQQNQTTLGVTRYFIGHAFKMQLDASYNHYNTAGLATPAKINNGWEFRFQIELGL